MGLLRNHAVLSDAELNFLFCCCKVSYFVNAVGNVTLGVFTVECILKIISCGKQPWNYFVDSHDGRCDYQSNSHAFARSSECYSRLKNLQIQHF